MDCQQKLLGKRRASLDVGRCQLDRVCRRRIRADEEKHRRVYVKISKAVCTASIETC